LTGYEFWFLASPARVTVPTELSRHRNTGNISAGAFLSQIPNEMWITLLVSAKPPVFSDSIEFVFPTGTDKIFRSSQRAVIKPMWTCHMGVSTSVKYMPCSELVMFSNPMRTKFVTTYMNKNLFPEFSTALGLTLSLFSATGVFDKPVTRGYFLRHRHCAFVQVLAVSHQLSVNVTQLVVITTFLVSVSLIVHLFKQRN
jgi:hypothetical protein